jgi:hypothetical protein
METGIGFYFRRYDMDQDWQELSSKSGFDEMTESELRAALDDASKLWLAHDGLWFQAVEKAFGIDAAIDADREAWRDFTKIEAKRIMSRLGISIGGLDELALALRHRLYANINIMKIEKKENSIRMTMTDCRVQSARKRKNLDFFPCKSVGIVEYAEFAKTINPRFETTCDFCPPDAVNPDGYCRWVFTLND